MRSTVSSTILAVVGLIVVARTPLRPAPGGDAATASKPTAALATMVPAPPRVGGILRVGRLPVISAPPIQTTRAALRIAPSSTWSSTA